MINYIVYGNTDYLDVLKIQTDYMFGDKHMTLFINKNDKDLSHIHEKYDKVVFYDDSETYASRLLSCLKQIDYEYFVFTHDIDILLNVDNLVINKFHEFLTVNNFDRIDLKYCDKISEDTLLIKYDNEKNASDWDRDVNYKNIDDGVYLVKQNDANNFIYNVNPSIWKRETMLSIMENFKHKNYRTIEDLDVQMFSKKYTVFKLFSNKVLDCGYFKCLDIYKYLHISHSGKFLPLNEKFVTIYGQSYNDIKEDYIKIVDYYNLKNNEKWIN